MPADLGKTEVLFGEGAGVAALFVTQIRIGQEAADCAGKFCLVAGGNERTAIVIDDFRIAADRIGYDRRRRRPWTRG